MSTLRRTAIDPKLAHSMKKLPLATKGGDSDTYHPSYRSLSAILQDDPSQAIVQTLPAFLIIESGPLRLSASGSPAGRTESCYRVETFEEAVKAFSAPLEN